VREQVESALVQLDYAVACGCEFYEFAVVDLEGRRDEGQREEEERED